MKGSYRVIIKENDAEYNFVVRRKYTLITGASCVGKSKIYRMIENRDTERKVIPLDSKEDNVSLFNLPQAKDMYERLLPCNVPTIFVVDEHIENYADIEFKELMKKSNAYFIIISRKPLVYEGVNKKGKIVRESLPIAISEVYTLHSEVRKPTLNREYYYNKFDNIYKVNRRGEHKIDMLITEDSSSGFVVYSNCFKDAKAVTAGGNANILKLLMDIDATNTFNNYIAVFIDGAAFGSFIESILYFTKRSRNKIIIYAPESFEWILLKALPKSIYSYEFVMDVINNPQKYCDKEAFGELVYPYKNYENDIGESWERLFTNYLIYLMSKTKFPYTKGMNISPFYNKFVNEVKKIIDTEL